SASTDSRNTAGCADVSSEKRTPSPVILRISATTSVRPLWLITCVAPSACASASRGSCTSTAMIGSHPAVLAASGPACPTRAHSEDGERISRFRPHRIKYCTGARLPAAGKRSEKLQRGILLDFHHVAFVGDGVGCEGGLLEEGAVNRSAILAHERGAVRTRPA